MAKWSVASWKCTYSTSFFSSPFFPYSYFSYKASKSCGCANALRCQIFKNLRIFLLLIAKQDKHALFMIFPQFNNLFKRIKCILLQFRPIPWWKLFSQKILPAQKKILFKVCSLPPSPAPSLPPTSTESLLSGLAINISSTKHTAHHLTKLSVHTTLLRTVVQPVQCTLYTVNCTLYTVVQCTVCAKSLSV